MSPSPQVRTELLTLVVKSQLDGYLISYLYRSSKYVSQSIGISTEKLSSCSFCTVGIGVRDCFSCEDGVCFFAVWFVFN